MSKDTRRPTVAELASIAAQVLPHVDDVDISAAKALEIWNACERVLNPPDHDSFTIMNEFEKLKRDSDDRVLLDSFIRCAASKHEARLSRFKKFVEALIRDERINSKDEAQAYAGGERLTQEERNDIMTSYDEVEERMTEYRNGISKEQASTLWLYWRAWLAKHHDRPCSVKIFRKYAFRA